MPRAAWGGPATAAWLSIFAVAALLNAGGYRFGASDQAFYVPAVARHVDPSLFPRDWRILGPQDELNAFTPLAGFLVDTVGVPLPALLLALYLLSIAVLGAGALAIGARLGRSRWTAIAILFAFSLRHAVALGAVNTLEGYMHPRLLAFGLGLLALGALLASRPWPVVGLLAIAAIVHPTTTVWFGVACGVGLLVSNQRWRPWVALLGVAAALASAWALALGPLASRMTPMDADWLALVASKRYLFPDRWPASAWAIVVLYVAVIGIAAVRRKRAGLATREEMGVLAGLAALLAAFALSLPFVAARVAFVVQLQVPRVLWILDLAAVALLVWLLCEGGSAPAPAPTRRRPMAVAIVILALAFARGGFVSFVEHPERPLLRAGLQDTDWNRALNWIERNTPPDAFVLADPGHAWRYGTSVRVGARRDVMLEEVKDTAMAMYSREAAGLVLERLRALHEVEPLSAEGARSLAARHDLTVLVAEADLDLPLLHREGRFSVYSLPGARR